MKKRILLCTALLAMSCIIFSCKKEKGVNDSATESKVIAITETKEVDTTVAKKNVETKNQIYTDEQISEAEKVASDYYKNFAHKVKDLKFKKIKGKKVIFQIYDETNEATRSIYLKLQNGKWKCCQWRDIKVKGMFYI